LIREEGSYIHSSKDVNIGDESSSFENEKSDNVDPKKTLTLCSGEDKISDSGIESNQILHDSSKMERDLSSVAKDIKFEIQDSQKQFRQVESTPSSFHLTGDKSQSSQEEIKENTSSESFHSNNSSKSSSSKIMKPSLKMSNEDNENEVEEKSQSLEMKRHKSRLSSKRTREKERSLMDALESERIRLYLSNTALKYHNGHLRDAIQALKTQISNPSSSIASSSSNQASENSCAGVPGVPRNVQYNPGSAGPRAVLPNNLAAALQQQQISQMVSPFAADLNQIAQANPSSILSGAALKAGMLQSVPNQTPFQAAFQADMSTRMLPAPITFPVAQIQPQPVNLDAAAAAAAALTPWQQVPPGITPQTRIRDEMDRKEEEGKR